MDKAERYTLTMSEVARRLGLTRQAVHELVGRNELPFVERLRGTQKWRYFDPEEVELLRQRRAAPNV